MEIRGNTEDNERILNLMIYQNLSCARQSRNDSNDDFWEEMGVEKL